MQLYHHGIKGQKWGVRRFQNEKGRLFRDGKKRYNTKYNPTSWYKYNGVRDLFEPFGMAEIMTKKYKNPQHDYGLSKRKVRKARRIAGLEAYRFAKDRKSSTKKDYLSVLGNKYDETIDRFIEEKRLKDGKKQLKKLGLD